MILNTKDLGAMSKIGNEAALKYVTDHDMETTVLRWKLRISTQADYAQDTALMYIWNAMGGYDLGKLCREWIAYGCGERAFDVLADLIDENGEHPKPSFAGSRIDEGV